MLLQQPVLAEQCHDKGLRRRLLRPYPCRSSVACSDSSPQRGEPEKHLLGDVELECVRIFRFPVFSRVSASRLLCVHTIDTLFSCVDSIVYKKTPRPASRAAHVEPSAMPERGVRFSGHALVVGERRIQFECEYDCDQARAFDEPLDAVHTPSCSMVLRTSASIWSKRLHHGAPLLPWINGTPACWSRLA